MMDLRIDPPTKPQYDHVILDFCSKEGAAEIKRRCEQFWDRRRSEKHGVAVTFWIEQMVDHSKTGRYFFCVRSNLVSGLPPS
jgi:hypothetical protein